MIGNQIQRALKTGFCVRVADGERQIIPGYGTLMYPHHIFNDASLNDTTLTMVNCQYLYLYLCDSRAHWLPTCPSRCLTKTVRVLPLTLSLCCPAALSAATSISQTPTCPPCPTSSRSTERGPRPRPLP